MKKAWKKMQAILLIMIGLGMACYPWLSNYLYEHAVDAEVQIYKAQTSKQSREEQETMRREAEEYNRRLSQVQVRPGQPFPQTREDRAYESLLPEIMCFVEIPKIDVYLPVYHGTSESVLQKGVGHVEGSSLPVGGAGNHSVLSGHTGINSAKLFTDLEEMEKGDTFFLHVLGQILAYQVADISVVEPKDTELLKPEKDRDLVTLLTCTPYGVNSHRLLVTGERIPYTEEVKKKAAEERNGGASMWMESYKKALGMGGGAALISLLVWEIIRLVRSRHALAVGGM